MHGYSRGDSGAPREFLVLMGIQKRKPALIFIFVVSEKKPFIFGYIEVN